MDNLRRETSPRHPQNTLGLSLSHNSGQVASRDIGAGYPREDEFDTDGHWHPTHPGYFVDTQHQELPVGHHPRSPPVYPSSPHDSFRSHESILSPLVLPDQSQLYRGSHSASPISARSWHSDDNTFNSYATSETIVVDEDPRSPLGEDAFDYYASPFTHRGEYIYGPSGNSPTAVSPMGEHHHPVDPSYLVAPPRMVRDRSGSHSSQHSRHSTEPRSSSHNGRHSRSHSYSASPNTPSTNLLMPPPREHRSRSGSRSSSRSRYSEDSHGSASHARRSSRSRSRSSSPIPPLTHSPYYSSPSPSPTPSFFQPSPGQPIILPIGHNAEHGYVVVPAAGQNVTVIPVQSTLTLQYPPGSSDVQGRIEEVENTDTSTALPSKRSRFRKFFSRNL